MSGVLSRNNISIYTSLDLEKNFPLKNHIYISRENLLTYENSQIHVYTIYLFFFFSKHIAKYVSVIISVMFWYISFWFIFVDTFRKNKKKIVWLHFFYFILPAFWIHFWMYKYKIKLNIKVPFIWTLETLNNIMYLFSLCNNGKQKMLEYFFFLKTKYNSFKWKLEIHFLKEM